MRIFLPSDMCEEFRYSLSDRAYKDKQSNLSYIGRANNGTISLLEWPDTPEISYDYVKEVWKDFAKVWDSGSNFGVKSRAEYALDDGSLIVCPTADFLSVYRGNQTDRYNDKELSWREEVVDLLTSGKLPQNFPFVVEFNPVATEMKRNVPTVVLIGREVWRANGERLTGYDVISVAFRSMANLIYMPNCINEPERMGFVYLNPSECIITPFCIIRKNEKGFGNTVFLRSIAFTNSESPGLKSIFDALKEEVFWTRILIPLATENFDALKVEIENQKVPLELQLKYFKLQSKKAIQDEIDTMKRQKEETQSAIDSYIREITNKKHKVIDLDEKIRDKYRTLKRGLASKPIEEEFARIVSLPYLEKVIFNGASVEFTTKPIPIDEYGPVLGGYTITYNVVEKHLNIHNNVNPSHMGLAHPHIYQDGDICFGNYSDVYFRFETGEFYVGLELLHEFLSTYNPEDEWGRRLIQWDARFVFEDMAERGLLELIESDYDNEYYALYDEHLPNAERCPECGELVEDCICNRCQYCGHDRDDCECWICPECGGEVGNDCYCDRCESCNELVGDCECERCDICEGLLDPYDQYTHHCECERCPYNYDIYVDTDDEGCCTECENWDCEHNCNEHHAMHQDESLFDELDEAV